MIDEIINVLVYVFVVYGVYKAIEEYIDYRAQKAEDLFLDDFCIACAKGTCESLPKAKKAPFKSKKK